MAAANKLAEAGTEAGRSSSVPPNFHLCVVTFLLQVLRLSSCVGERNLPFQM